MTFSVQFYVQFIIYLPFLPSFAAAWFHRGHLKKKFEKF